MVRFTSRVMFHSGRHGNRPVGEIPLAAKGRSCCVEHKLVEELFRE